MNYKKSSYKNLNNYCKTTIKINKIMKYYQFILNKINSKL